MFKYQKKRKKRLMFKDLDNGVAIRREETFIISPSDK
jgi:hypothetical protein